ncbi:helix-turn-helix domain-containing protein [Clostridium sp. Cult2]|uniref:helix-turn-helix domain-containing protein n=1 Tax=Clostridium sp. Cult2 TaxID=2079003 RepID=UPI001F3E452D|nr:helix-turn-helix transcriptional regulator [Clostridium sp. Cult2]MCF6466389.1 XRE family transcriptional regulator [Clostridium sp. Cult2]
MSNFSDRLKELRIESGILQRELADYLKVSRVTITQYESGNRSPDDEIKKKIAKYFNVSLDYLMGVSDVKNPYSEKSIEEEYKEEIQALEKFRQVMINKGLDYKNKTYEELAEIVVKHIKVQDILNSDNSKSN